MAEEKSAKMEIQQIRIFRRLLSSYRIGERTSWDLFCQDYLVKRLTPIWQDAEQELGLNFISLRSDDHDQYLNSRPEWSHAVQLMGRHGIASSDAMILNMFLCSKISVLLTSDLEMADCVIKEAHGAKQVFVPDSLVDA
jgi:hypothetical protein